MSHTLPTKMPLVIFFLHVPLNFVDLHIPDNKPLTSVDRLHMYVTCRKGGDALSVRSSSWALLEVNLHLDGGVGGRLISFLVPTGLERVTNGGGFFIIWVLSIVVEDVIGLIPPCLARILCTSTSKLRTLLIFTKLCSLQRCFLQL